LLQQENQRSYGVTTIELNDLRESHEFLNLIVDKIMSAVFLVNKKDLTG
jgi:hypothetical protein